MSVIGWLSVPFVLVGTGMVAIMPERMARLAIRSVPLAILDPPFRTDDPAVRWLLRVLTEVARRLLRTSD